MAIAVKPTKAQWLLDSSPGIAPHAHIICFPLITQMFRKRLYMLCKCMEITSLHNVTFLMTFQLQTNKHDHACSISLLHLPWSYHRYSTLRSVEYLQFHILSTDYSMPSSYVLLPSLLLPVAAIWQGEEATCSEAESRSSFWGTAYTTGTGKCVTANNCLAVNTLY